MSRRIECIVYWDHFQEEDGWKDTDVVLGDNALKCCSVGWLLDESDNVVRLCANFSDPEGDDEQMCSAMNILKCCIVSRTVLHD